MLTKAAQLDALIALANHGGCDLSSFQRWHTLNVPTLRGAIELAEAAGVTIERKQVEAVRRRNGRTETRVVVWIRGSVVASASISTDPVHGGIIATGLAFRNAVQRLCCDVPRVWRQQPDEFQGEYHA